jgi:hypothetical protein
MNTGELRDATLAALAELRALHTTEPAARGALDTVRLTIRTLECWWLPALDELCDEAPAQ